MKNKASFFSTDTNHSKEILSPLANMCGLIIGGHVVGPIAAKELAAQGAKIYKIEPKEGDPARHYLHPALFDQINRGLLSIIAEPVIYQQLLACVDFVIDNRSPGAKLRDTVLQNHLKNLEKPLIYCAISGYGENHDEPVMDVIAQASSGIAYTNAFSTTQPLKVGYTVADYNTGKTAAFHILSTWIGMRLHPNQYPEKLVRLEVSLIGELVNQQFGQVLNCLNSKKEVIRNGNQDLFLSPFSFYLTKDEQFLAVAIGTKKQFEALCHAFNKADWLEKYTSNQTRLTNPDFEREFSDFIFSENIADWLAQFKKIEIPAAKVNRMVEALQTDYVKSYLGENTTSQYKVVHPACKNSASHHHSLFDTIKRAPTLNEHHASVTAHITSLVPKSKL